MLSTGSAFSIQVHPGPQAIEVQVGGTIDESAALEPPTTGGKPVVIDCSAVRRLNSMGVAGWIRFMDGLTRQGPVLLKRMSPAMVIQASMISSFVGPARVGSFLTPWVCLSCDTASELEHGFDDAVPETSPCPKCGTAMELDSDREAYLAFREA